MCAVLPAAYAAVTAITTAVSTAAEEESAAANKSVIDQQAKIRANQIAIQAGNAESNAAKEARAAQAQSIVAAGAAGISTKSNSFIASLQTTALNASQSEQALTESEQNSEAGNTAQANSELAQSASAPTFMGASLDTALAGAGAYVTGAAMTKMYDPAPTAGSAGTSASLSDYSSGAVSDYAISQVLGGSSGG